MEDDGFMCVERMDSSSISSNKVKKEKSKTKNAFDYWSYNFSLFSAFLFSPCLISNKKARKARNKTFLERYTMIV